MALTLSRITLQAYNGKYVSRIARHGDRLEADKIVADGYCQLAVVSNSDGTYSFKTDNGKYANYKSSTDEIVVSSDTIEPTSKFTVDINGPGVIVMRASNGKYLVATETGDPDNFPIMATGDRIVASVRFVVAQVMIAQGQYNRV